MSQHEHCPDCQDDNQKELQNLVENEEMSCCQGKKQEVREIEKKPVWQKITNLFKK